jgi:hypothetical protein
VYGIHNNHDHIDEGYRVKGERRKRVGERWGGMRETGDKGKKGEKGERSRGREKGEEEWEKTTPVLPLVLLRDGNLIGWWPSVIHV